MQPSPSSIGPALPYVVWLPVLLAAALTAVLAVLSPRPAARILWRGGSFVLILALLLLLAPLAPRDVTAFFPGFFGLALLVSFVAYLRRTPMQRKFGSLATLMEAFKKGDYETALTLCDGPDLRKYPDVDADFFRGAAFYHLRRLNEAESSLRIALSRHPPALKNALILDQLALVFLEQGRRGDAVANFQRSRELNPRRGGGFRGEANVYLRGKYELANALELARQAVEVDRKQPADLRAYSLSTSLATLGWALAANARPEEARESVREALALSPPDDVHLSAEDHYLAAQAMLALGDRGAASQYFRKVSELEPKGNFGWLARQELAGGD